MAVTIDGSANTITAEATSATTATSATIATSATSLTTASGSAPSYSARAWVNFNGQGTVAIRAGGNVSSITDNGVGNYTVNFTTAMPDANYSVTANAKITNAQNAGSSNEPLTVGPNSWLTTSVGVASNYATTPNDPATMSVVVFR